MSDTQPLEPQPTRRFPVITTLVVLLAVVTMARLGFWQLERLHQKEALLRTYSANEAAPEVALPALMPFTQDKLFRRVAAFCLQPTEWKASAGEARGGGPGWRHVARCRTGAEGPGFAVDVGISSDPKPPVWSGGAVHGRLTAAPDNTSLIAKLFGAAPPLEPMIVSDAAAPGLQASARPDPASVPNNHLSYAVQWFLFAGVALVIYAIALWRRLRSPVQPDDRPA